uniref:Uncharacterized protein n=1 Tax=Oryza meridionalis TaxID=40149 RepID=A0A0E0CHY1_9ORYZ
MRVPIIVSHPRCQLTAPSTPKFPSTSRPQHGGSGRFRLPLPHTNPPRHGGCSPSLLTRCNARASY